MGNSQSLRDLALQLRSRRIDRRRFLQGAAAAGASATAISSALRVAPTRAQGSGNIQFWTAWTAKSFENIKAVVDAYNAQATSNKVDLVQIPPGNETDITKLMTAVRGGTGPDLYQLDRFTVAQRAADGILQDLSAMGADDVITKYIEFAQKEATFQGKVYALPLDTDVRAIYYNRDLLNASGVDPAPLDPANGPLTWDKIAELANQVNKQDGNGNYTQMGFVPWINQGWHYTYGFSFGAKFFDPASCSVTPDEQAMVDASTWVQNYCKNLGADKVSAFGDPSMQPSFDPSQHPFHLGQLAMQITGDWEIAQMAQYAPNIDYGITWTAVPKEGDKSVTWGGGWSIIVPQGAKNAEGAWAAMQWMTGEDGNRVYCQASSQVPVVKSLQSDESLFQGKHSFFQDVLPTAVNRPVLPVGSKYWDELTVAWQKIYKDQAAPADALKDVKDHVQPDLQRFCPLDTGG